MALDANGIWQYEETEAAAPVSTMLNRLAESVSDAVEPLVTVSGPHAVAAAAGYASTLTVERVGRVVYATGALAPNVNWGTAHTTSSTAVLAGGIPTDCTPAANKSFLVPTAAGTVATFFRVTVTSTGSITVRCSTSTYTSNVVLDVSWLVP